MVLEVSHRLLLPWRIIKRRTTRRTADKVPMGTTSALPVTRDKKQRGEKLDFPREMKAPKVRKADLVTGHGPEAGGSTAHETVSAERTLSSQGRAPAEQQRGYVQKSQSTPPLSIAPPLISTMKRT